MGTRFAFNFEPFTNVHVTYFEPFTNAHATYPTFMRRYVSRIDYVGRTQWLSLQLSNHCRLTPLSKSYLVLFLSSAMMNVCLLSEILIDLINNAENIRNYCGQIISLMTERFVFFIKDSRRHIRLDGCSLQIVFKF